MKLFSQFTRFASVGTLGAGNLGIIHEERYSSDQYYWLAPWDSPPENVNSLTVRQPHLLDFRRQHLLCVRSESSCVLR